MFTKLATVAAITGIVVAGMACNLQSQTTESVNIINEGQHHRVCVTSNEHGRPENVSASKATPTSVTVDWTNPNNDQFEARVQLMQFFDGQTPRVIRTLWVMGQPGANKFVVDGLETGERYVASVSLHWHDALGIRCSTSVPTESIIPS